MKTYAMKILGLVLVAVALSTSVWATIGSGQNDEKKGELLMVNPDTLLAETNDYDRLYLEALCQRLAGHDSLASSLLGKALALNPDAAEAYYLQSEILADTDAKDEAFENMCRAAQLQPANDTYQESVADTYIRRGEMDKAVAAYEGLYSHHRDRSDILRTLVAIFMYQKKYDSALSTLDRMEIVDGKSDELTSLRMQIYNQKGDDKNFYKTLSGLIDEHPYDTSYKVMLGNWLVARGRMDEAGKFLKAAVGQDSEDSFALTSLLDYYNNVGDTAAVSSLRDRILFSPQTDADTRAKMLTSAILDARKAHGDSVTILGLIDRTMQTAPKEVAIANLKAAYMKLAGMPQDSVNAAYRHSLLVAPDNMEARINLIQNNWSDHALVQQLAKEGTLYNPESEVFYYFLGLAYYQTDQLDLALEALRKGVAEVGLKSSDDVVSDMYAMMGEVLYKKEMYDEAFAAYDSCLQWKADNYSCLNNYAYFLSEQNRDIKRAERMSYKTIEAEPTNATFLDTYAWILYLEERYDEAKAYIERAIDNDSVPSSTVMEHAGDICCKAGDAKGAAQYWQKAIESGGDEAVLRRKIKTGKVE